jgi:hypothetical protein
LEHRADALFALPALPATARLIGELPGWERDLAERGVEIVAGACDLAVASPDRIDEALAAGAPAVIVDGGRRSPARLRAGGLSVQRLLPLPLEGSPVLYLDLDRRRAASYALRHGISHTERWRALRNRGVAVMLRAGVFPAVDALVSVGARAPGEAALVRAAAPLGVPAGANWTMLVSAGSIVRRNALLLFPARASEPAWVLKFSRVPGATAQFDREQRGFALVERAGGGALARHAPTYFGRARAGAYHLSVETAGTGPKLATLLRQPSSTARKRTLLEAVADWLIQVARETAAASPGLQPELDRIGSEVLPFWDRPGLATGLERLPASFQHNDMGEDNLIMGRDGFVAVDWEWAQPHGLPLGDLLYFGSHVLRLLDGALLEEERDPHFEALVTGRAPSSPVLFRWMRRLADTIGIPPEAVGPLATLSWLDHGWLSARERGKAEAASGRRLGEAYAERCARTWLTHPDLGAEWSVFTA